MFSSPRVSDFTLLRVGPRKFVSMSKRNKTKRNKQKKNNNKKTATDGISSGFCKHRALIRVSAICFLVITGSRESGTVDITNAQQGRGDGKFILQLADVYAEVTNSGLDHIS